MFTVTRVSLRFKKQSHMQGALSQDTLVDMFIDFVTEEFNFIFFKSLQYIYKYTLKTLYISVAGSCCFSIVEFEVFRCKSKYIFVLYVMETLEGGFDPCQLFNK